VPRAVIVFRLVRTDIIYAIQKGALTDELRTSLLMHEKEFESYLLRAREGIADTSDETSAIIQPALEKAEGAFAKFDAFVKSRILEPQTIDATLKVFYDTARPATASLSDLSAAAYLATTSVLNERLESAVARRNVTAGIVGIALFTALALTWLVTRSMTQPMSQAIAVFRSIAAGMYNNRIENIGTDESSEVLHALDELQEKLRTQGNQSQATAELRIKSTLDKASARLMFTDESLKIIYVNDATQRFLREARGDLRREFPQLDVDNIIGESADAFFGNRLAQRRGFDQTAPFETDLRVGARSLKATAHPLMDGAGRRVGTAVELTESGSTGRATDPQLRIARVAAVPA
jgi:PAS domain-containing protein